MHPSPTKWTTFLIRFYLDFGKKIISSHEMQRNQKTNTTEHILSSSDSLSKRSSQAGHWDQFTSD